MLEMRLGVIAASISTDAGRRCFRECVALSAADGVGMDRPEKILARCQARSRISFREFEQLLAAFGFRVVRTKGSHRMYRNETIRRTLSVQSAGKDAKAYQVRMLLSMIEEFQLRLRDDA